MNEIIEVIKEHYQLKQLGIYFVFPLEPAMIRFDDQLWLSRLPDDLHATLRKCYFDKEPVTLMDKLNLKHLYNYLSKQEFPSIWIDYADPDLFDIIANF